MPSPACVAVMMQAPAPVRWMVLPVFVHWSVAPVSKLTGKPELAVAVITKSASP